MAKRAKKKKPYFHGDITCPKCKSELEIISTRKNLNPPSPIPDYSYETRVQLKMLPTSDGGGIPTSTQLKSKGEKKSKKENSKKKTKTKAK